MAVFRALGSLAFLGLFVVGCACAGPAEPGGFGEQCFRAADCQPGLVCLMAHCTNQVGDAVSMVDGPDPVVEPMPDGGAMAGAGGAPVGGAGGSAGAGGASGAAGGGGAAGAAGAAGTAGTGGAAGAGGTGGSAGTAGGGTGGTPMMDAGSSDAG